MKVLMLNGSPHEHGNTYLALCEMQKVFEDDNIESEIVHVGVKPVVSCISCGGCEKLKKCVFDDDGVNNFVQKMIESDALVVGTPVHYAGATGAVTSFLGRAFYSGWRSGKNPYTLKPACAVAVARRAGTSATLDQINKFFTIAQMPIISGRYWNNVYGQTPGQVNNDLEGMQNLRYVAKNMAYFLKLIKLGKETGVNPPIQEDAVFTNFVR